MAIALLIAAALGYRALLLHQRDAARAEAAHLSASLADAEASNAALQKRLRPRTRRWRICVRSSNKNAGGDGARARGDRQRSGSDALGGQRRAGARERADRHRLRGGDPMGQRAGGGAWPM